MCLASEISQDEGLEVLAEGCPLIEKLNLEVCKITDQGVKAIANGFTSLVCLIFAIVKTSPTLSIKHSCIAVPSAAEYQLNTMSSNH
jgi:hypothetical protein